MVAERFKTELRFLKTNFTHPYACLDNGKESVTNKLNTVDTSCTPPVVCGPDAIENVIFAMGIVKNGVFVGNTKTASGVYTVNSAGNVSHVANKVLADKDAKNPAAA